MPALSPNNVDDHTFFPGTETTVLFIILFVCLGGILIRRRILYGSVTTSTTEYQPLKMSTSEVSETEKTQPHYTDDEGEPKRQDENLPHLKVSGHSRSLSSTLPPPTLKPYLSPISSASNAEYFSSSPMTDTPSTFSPTTNFSSPTASYSQSTSYSESQEQPTTDGPTRRRSYTKTLSLPSPNQPIAHPSAQTIFPASTSRAAPDAYVQPGGVPLYYTASDNMIEVEVQGEIIVAEGWRRHTRVFGGGVCKACEESKEKEIERRGTA
ncbi:hypothetical protein GLAREA_00908 [Glarea lozoyensis ATCC 20868]|uniref:Uncharacterized protein n=1 Tax=Glarea lozoyensis (strain ATCC 20868 / MF5171) TaxID=1116229 RepID=S3DTM1_GLAL2|nr:uncharacterized protein GLAREA_00908 [Glarea lozoyensis ATCC 20868]EPE29748.1 hypothetical protein GLAREA_00908 [Glarea lozoyensis ATCC 20868]